MSKIKLFLDFDSTICNSIKSFCDSYNILYSGKPNFTLAQWVYVEQWNFRDQCPLVDNVHDIFEHNLFFKHLEFIDCKAEEVIQKLCNRYEVIIATIGTPLNVAKKAIWINDNMPYIKECIYLTNAGVKMNKSVIEMSGSVFIDDHADSLNSSNAKHKIIFGDIYEWNRDSKYTRCFNWTDVERLLL